MKKPVYLVNHVSEENSSSSILNAGLSFTGGVVGTLDWSSVIVSVKTDQQGSFRKIRLYS